jgi:hypothetical protein
MTTMPSTADSKIALRMPPVSPGDMCDVGMVDATRFGNDPTTPTLRGCVR